MPDYTTAMAEAEPETKLLLTAESASKAAGALAAAGYISVRAHENYLGIPPGIALEPSRYLFEVWYLVSTTIAKLAWLALPALLLGLLIQLLLRHRGGLQGLLSRIRERCARSYPAFTFPFALLLVSIAAIVTLDIVLPQRGVLLSTGIEMPRPVNAALFDVGLMAWLLLALCVRALNLGSDAPETAHGAPASSRVLMYRGLVIACRVSIWFLAAGLCMLFGTAVHSRDYPLVELGEDPATLTGVLVSSAGGRLILVTCKDNRTGLISVPSDDTAIRFQGQVKVGRWHCSDVPEQ